MALQVLSQKNKRENDSISFSNQFKKLNSLMRIKKNSFNLVRIQSILDEILNTNISLTNNEDKTRNLSGKFKHRLNKFILFIQNVKKINK